MCLILVWACFAVGVSVLDSCGGGGSGGGNPDPPKLQSLNFQGSPQSGLAGRPFGAPIQVAMVDKEQGPSDVDVTVSIRLEGAPGTDLRGTLERPLVNGVATFDDLIIDRHGQDLTLVASAELSTQSLSVTSLKFSRGVKAGKRHVILMISDGWGYPEIAAEASFSGQRPPYANLSSFAMSTWDVNVKVFNGDSGYDPKRAWEDFGYLVQSATDSASSATAMYTGVKTNSGRISVGPGAARERLQTIGDLARMNGVGVGAVTSVPISHATPAAFVAHNDSRAFTRPITDEMLFGDPATTGGPVGAHGPSPILPDVLIGGGHPVTGGNYYVSVAQWVKAKASGWTVVDRWGVDGEPHNGAPARLIAKAAQADRLFGLFGSFSGNIPFRLHDGSGQDPEEPTLAQMSKAALLSLERQSRGFCVMIEGGAIDWAGHRNSMSQMIGEMIGFNDAVREVISWIEDPSNGSDWNNTLLIVTGDHETGLLTAGPRFFPDKPLGEVTDARIRAETYDYNYGVVASWDDANGNGRIDYETSEEEIYWAWNTTGHSNCLIPCYFKGLASERFEDFVVQKDPVRGDYIDNTAIYKVMLEALRR
jgi:alkaline phosphatase